MYVLLHCCSAVCSKGLVGGWVEGALRRPWWVGGPFCTWESSFCVLWEMNPFFCFYNTGLPLVLGSTTVPTAALLCPLLPYVLLLLHCRTAAVLSFLFCKTYIQRMIPLLPHVRRHCRTALLLFGSFSTQYRGYSTNLFLSAIPAGNCHVSGVPLVLCNTVG